MTVIEKKTLYSDYLQLDKILNSQELFSELHGETAHDEMLFIIVHQVYELWFRQVLYEVDSILNMFRSDHVHEQEMRIATHRTRRVVKILDLCVRQFRVLESMTPLDFLEFRDILGTMSGFQSMQFRLLENKLGLKREHRHGECQAAYDRELPCQAKAEVRAAENAPSLFDCLQSWLERTPFLEREDFRFLDSYREGLETMLANERKLINESPVLTKEDKKLRLSRLDSSTQHYYTLLDAERYKEMTHEGNRMLSHRAMMAGLFIHLYRDYPMLQMPYNLLNAVHEMDTHLTHWRYRHSLMIQRMIGSKMGTGGSPGYSYLRETVEKHQVFADFNHLSTLLIPRKCLPALPDTLQKDLNFFYAES